MKVAATAAELLVAILVCLQSLTPAIYSNCFILFPPFGLTLVRLKTFTGFWGFGVLGFWGPW